MLSHSASGARRGRRESNAHGRANPNGFQGRGRHQSAGVSNRRKVGDSNARRCDPVRRFQRRSSTSRTPSIVRRRAESNRQGLRSSRFERGAVTTSAGSSRWSGWPDSNRRPPRPERGALTKLRYNPVGMAGVEPAASEPPARRATAAPHPGTHARSRTSIPGFVDLCLVRWTTWA